MEISTLSRFEIAHVASLLGNPPGRRTLPESIVEQYDLANRSTDTSIRERWMKTVTANFEYLLGNFDDVAEIPVLPVFWHPAIQIMIEHDLQSYDALHVATARSVEVADFATTDCHYSQVDGLTVHLTRDG